MKNNSFGQRKLAGAKLVPSGFDDLSQVIENTGAPEEFRTPAPQIRSLVARQKRIWGGSWGGVLDHQSLLKPICLKILVGPGGLEPPTRPL
jgi:hypothetical protein